ncbi:hypothetical protein RYX36_033109 [Vicia faba]
MFIYTSGLCIIEDFAWLNSSYSPVLKQLSSPSMIDYYFKAHRASSDSNLKFRNPKYLSMLNHLRFYLPEIFPSPPRFYLSKIDGVLFLRSSVAAKAPHWLNAAISNFKHDFMESSSSGGKVILAYDAESDKNLGISGEGEK